MTSLLKYRYTILLFLALLANTIYYSFKGVVVVTDSITYLQYAQNLTRGILIPDRVIWYTGYCIFLAVFLKIGLGIKSIVFIQVILSSFSVLALQKATENFSKNSLLAFLSGFCYLLFLEVFQWNMYVLTESIFASCICFFLLFLSMYWMHKSNKDLIFSIFIALFIFWIRPLGIALLVAIGVFLFLEKMYTIMPKPVLYVFLGVFLALVLYLANTMLHDYALVENYITGEVIFNFSKIPNYLGHQYALVTLPNNLTFLKEGSTVSKALYFYVQNPIFSIKLALLKGFFFLSHTKPYYSTMHNICILVMLLPAYIGLVSFIKKNKSTIMSFVLVYLGCTTCIVMLTCEDWDGRFFMGILPFLCCFGYPYISFLRSFTAPYSIVKNKNITL